MNIERPKSKQPIPEHAKKVFKGVVFDVYQWEQEMFDGTKAIFERARRQDSVTIFPVLPDGRILLNKEEQPSKPSFIGTPGGRVEDGESLLDAAKRELLEESGYKAEEFIFWFAQNAMPKVDWAVYIFIAKGLKKVADLNLDSGEKIKSLPVTLDELIEMPNHKDINFREQEIVLKLFEAKYNSQKKKELEELFKPLDN
jgi:ADP-ribose pyrophosphatase